MSIPNGICLKWKGRGFGNHLILAHVVKILNDNGINAAVRNHRKIDGLVDVPIYDYTIHQNYITVANTTPNTTHQIKNIDEPFIIHHLRAIENIFQKNIIFDRTKHNHIPVIFHEMDVPEIDVVLCTTSSHYGLIRNWPYFNELKTKLQELNITYIDLNEKGILGIECLNYVKKCKVYLGLETGTSHYVSKFANGKGLIIQSGFCPFYVWAFPYNYKPIIDNIECPLRPCFLDMCQIAAGITCPLNNKCINDITVETVLNEILQMIGR